jgi:hypothetical protein
MQWQTVVDNSIIEAVFRTVRNSLTASLTITARTIAVHSPVILETNTASLPSTTANSSKPFYPSTNGKNFANRAATSTSLVNNLLLGLLAVVPGTKAYLEAEADGLVQCYGVDPQAIVQIPPGSSAIAPGNVLLPESLQFLILGVGPVTAASTGTAAHVEQPAIGGLIIAMGAVASSSASGTTTAPVFIRCM